MSKAPKESFYCLLCDWEIIDTHKHLDGIRCPKCEGPVMAGRRGCRASNTPMEVRLMEKKWFDIEGSIEVDVDEETFNKELLEWFESKEWTFAGVTKPSE